MPEYGEIRVDYITYTTGTSPNEGQGTVTVSGLINNPTFSGNVIIANDLTVSGKGIFASGTESTPSITFTGDTNTGLYSPGANQVALSTNGTGRLFVDASGRVGVNNASPSASLSVSGVSDTTDIAVFERDFNTVDPALVINNLSANANAGSRVSFRNAGTERAYIEYQLGTGTTPSLRFGTAGFERLRITSAGLVGVGTSSPGTVGGGATLNINQTGGARVVLNSASRPFYITGGSGSDDLRIGRRITTDTVDSDTVTITGGGNVGIGTTSPGQRLTVGDGSATGVNYLRIHSANSDVLIGQSGGSAFGMGTSLGSVVGSDATNQPLAVGTFQSQPLLLGTNNQERARIDSSGRLLVGTSSDSGGALLQVNGDRIRVATAKTPASASDTGTTGEICWDASYIYVCTATNTWKRAALSTW